MGLYRDAEGQARNFDEERNAYFQREAEIDEREREREREGEGERERYEMK